jgi:hypothetical protein
VKRAAAGALVALFVIACGPDTTGGAASSPRTSSTPPTTSQPTASAAPASMSTKLYCDSHIGATALAIYGFGLTPPFVEMLDVSNPLKPSLVCRLTPAYGAQFLSDTKLAFWVDDQLGTADLGSGAITQTARLAGRAGTGAFSADGTKFAYRVFDDSGGMSTHLYVNGSDRTLYTQEPLGGHGGPIGGPLDQLEFSADGSQLIDFYEFRPMSGPAKFLVYRTSDAFLAFQSSSAGGGVWSRTGTTLYFSVWNPQPPGPSGELDSLDAAGRQQMVARFANGIAWPRLTPDGAGIIYDTYDGGGQPHIWRFDLATHTATQLSEATGSIPIFVNPNAIWFDEEQPCRCGPGGSSAPDGVTLSHDMSTGRDAIVDTTLIVPGIGGPPLPGTSTRNLLDVWLAPA